MLHFKSIVYYKRDLSQFSFWQLFSYLAIRKCDNLQSVQFSKLLDYTVFTFSNNFAFNVFVKVFIQNWNTLCLPALAYTAQFKVFLIHC